MQHHPAELIAIKRDGGELDEARIRDLVGGVVDGSLGDVQLGAWLMAVCCRGMSVAETSALTRAMRDSGRCIEHTGLAAKVVDKHSTGGVGDKVSLLLAPWVAAAGVPVPMVSGRGLGHTGGTLDKLAAIPGYRTALSIDEIRTTVAACGYAMAAPSGEIAPADARMYAARDVSGTVESVPLITASILAKKLAAGIEALVMDVKCGRAAFMRERAAAEALMRSLVETGRAAGIEVVALLTDMDAPLGRAAGNALEVREVAACLAGDGPPDLLAVTRALAAEMLVLGGVDADVAAAGARLDDLLGSGAVRACLERNVQLQGGDPGFLDRPDRLHPAPVVRCVEAGADGFVGDVDPLVVGLCVRDLGGGRTQPSDAIDPRVGVVLRAVVGDRVARGAPLAELHAASEAAAAAAAGRLASAFTVTEAPPLPRSLILGRHA